MTEQEYIQNEEFLKQIKLFKSGHKDAMERLIVYSESLVKKMSKKYYSILLKHHIPLEDIEQECYVAYITIVMYL